MLDELAVAVLADAVVLSDDAVAVCEDADDAEDAVLLLADSLLEDSLVLDELSVVPVLAVEHSED